MTKVGYLRKKLSCVATPLCEKRALVGVVPGWSRTKSYFARAKARRGVHMNIINLTPHTVNICTEDGDIECSFKSEGVARASQVAVPFGDVNGIELVEMRFGPTVDLPDPEAGTVLIVSAITASAAKAEGRSTDDLVLTADTVRDKDGRIVGCRRFARV